MDRPEKLKLFAAIAVCQLTGIIGSFFTSSSVTTWYRQLERPAFTPAGWVFAPVWTILYFLMGVSLYLIWKKDWKNRKVKIAFWLFVVHLGFNLLWSFLFFELKEIKLALFEIIFLAFQIVVLIAIFFRIDRRASILLVPYLMWVGFAAFLNLRIFQLNR